MIDFFRPGALKWRPPCYRKLDMTVDDGKAYIQAKIKQKSGSKLDAKLLIDTGANHGLLLNRETSEEITMPLNFIESELGQSLGGVLYGFIGRVNSLSIGGLTMREDFCRPLGIASGQRPLRTLPTRALQADRGAELAVSL